MKNFKTQYTVVGSSALKDNVGTHIIEFPFQEELEGESEANSHGIKGVINRFAYTFLSGSLQGYSVNKSKPWQSILAGSFFFIFAMACVYFGR